jgi:uncharacterized protein YyaL (SSP411 family)
MAQPHDAGSGAHPFTNRLIHETSPYLLQHAHNPVDWYPWGPEAFEAARLQGKPLFLSVGYSTCYWCHVMERQSFENEAIAREMNERFINIKVDREERPDVDQLYMTAVQVLTRQGGWPMSVFLTPDRRPFYGGTYFPPADAYGRPGFPTLLRGIDDAWRNRRQEVEKSANGLVEIIGQLAEPVAPKRPIAVDRTLIEQLIERSTDDYEPTFGGFGQAPKFPRETLLELLLEYVGEERSEVRRQRSGGAETGTGDAVDRAATATSKIQNPKSKILRMLLHTLDAMAHGGIRDHLGGGFHRYSTDAKWLVPHFEIMLYDNAMLGWVYAEAHRQTGDPRYAQVARDVFDFVLREMTSPDGAFYTALDAEVDAMEGGSYLWTAAEVEQVLGADDARLFNRVYGLDRGPNFADPHHGTGVPDKNILSLPQPDATGQSALLDPNLRRMREKLYAARGKRKPPLLDTKILTSWNALMIRAMAHAGKVLGERRYLDAAARAADFLLTRHRAPDGGLHRASGGGTTREGGPRTAPRESGGDPASQQIPGFLDDYAFLAQALLALGGASDAGNAGDRWRTEARPIASLMAERFGDPEYGGFFFTDKSATDLIVRQKTASDSPLPSGNAVAAMVLLELGRVDDARQTVAAFAQQLEQHGEGMSSMVQAALLTVRRAGPFTVSAAPGTSDASAPSDADRPLSPQQVAEQVVTIRTEWAGPLELRIRLSILRGFHVNAHDPASDLPLIGTRLTAPDLDVASIDYPPGEEQTLGFSDAPVRVYSGEAGITVRLRTPPPADQPARVSLYYQACDDTACLPPVTKTVELKSP